MTDTNDETTEPTAEAAPQPSEESSEAESAEAPVDPLEAMTAERDKLKEQLLRMAADFDNFRKRSRREVEDTRKRAKEDVLREILPIIDNLERAVAASEGATDVKAVVDGVRMVLKGFEATAQGLGLTRVGAAGQQFDPTLHDALQQIETDEHPPGKIVAEIVPGYRLGERLLRAAQVVVAKAPAAPAAEVKEAPADEPEGSPSAGDPETEET